MCMCGTVKKEKEDFKKLYEGIKNDVVRERIRASGEWYIENAAKYRFWFYVFTILGIVAPLAITVISSIGAEGDGAVVARVAIAVCSVLATFSSTFLAVSKCKEKWTNYRHTVERIKSVLVKYSVEEGEDSEKLRNLVERTEQIMKEEHDRWKEISEKDEQVDKKQDRGMKDTGEKNNQDSGN